MGYLSHDGFMPQMHLRSKGLSKSQKRDTGGISENNRVGKTGEGNQDRPQERTQEIMALSQFERLLLKKSMVKIQAELKKADGCITMSDADSHIAEALDEKEKLIKVLETPLVTE